jgi:D-amino peptidase
MPWAFSVIASTKEGIGVAELGKHPLVANEEIRDAVSRALGRLQDFEPYRFDPPYTMVLKVRREPEELFPGATKTGAGEYTFTSDDLLEVIRAFDVLH